MAFYLEQPIHIEPGVIRGAFQHLDETFGGVVPRTKRKRADGGIHDVATGFDGFHERDQRDSGSGMDVKMHQRLLATALLDTFDQIVGGLRLQQGGHVLDADRIAALLDQLLRHFGKGFNGMHRADGITDRALRVLAGLLDRPKGSE